MTASATSAKVLPTLRENVCAWLEELQLAHLTDAVLEWCEEAGAAELEEVVESCDDMVDALGLSESDASQILSRGSVAMENLRAGGQRQTGDLPRRRTRVVCFEFSNIICDTSRLYGINSWRYAKKMWPSLDIGRTPTEWLGVLKYLRPALSHDSEGALLLRILVASGAGSKPPERRKGNAPMSGGFANLAGQGHAPDSHEFYQVVEWVLTKWAKGGLQEILTDYNVAHEELVRGYEELDSGWMAGNWESWISSLRPNEAILNEVDRLQTSGAVVFLLSSLPRRVCEAVLTSCGSPIPSDHIFDPTHGTRADILRGLVARQELSGRTFHVIADRLAVIKNLEADSSLGSINLHLGDWGCSSKSQKTIADSPLHKCTLISAQGLKELAKFELQ